MVNYTLITRIMGISKAAIAEVKLNYPNQLQYAKSPEGGIMITGDSNTLADVLRWLESNAHMHSVRRQGSRYFCEQLLLSLQEGELLTLNTNELSP